MKMAQTNKLFGTDGVRGVFGQFPMDHESLLKLGRAAGEVLRPRKLLFGRDTRKSGASIMSSLAGGWPEDSELFDCGVIPTPGLSLATQVGDFDWGIMITASHNPFTDNGVKIFDGSGEKISEELERRIEDAFFGMTACEGNKQARLSSYDGLRVYQDFLGRHFPGVDEKTTSFKCVVDCANGAASEIAVRVFAETGFESELIHHRPDGENINRMCGSTYLDSVRERVLSTGADLGIAFDGDGDRVLFVDSEGFVLTGDHALFFISQYLFDSLPCHTIKPVVVGTIMSNLGLEKALQEKGIDFIRAAVGDKHVYREMVTHDAMLGGEESGHTILRLFQKTGDGLLTALYFLRAMISSGKKPSDLRSLFHVYPQVTRSLRIREKIDLAEWEDYKRVVDSFLEKHGDHSRVVIRYSGTEPKIRIMVESKFQEIVDEYIVKFEDLIKSRLGE